MNAFPTTGEFDSVLEAPRLARVTEANSIRTAEEIVAPHDAGWAAVEAIDLSQFVGHTQILHNINLAVQCGELVAVAGGSGAGKSTLLSALAGVASPGGGQALIGGAVAGVARFEVGYVPQDDIIHREMPLGRTLRYAARLRFPNGSTETEIEFAVERVLRQLELSDRADLPVGSLSGGQRKRASIATELLTDPGVVMLDEPTSGLDPSTGAAVVRQLRDLAHSGHAVIMTTHVPADLALCDRVVFLAPGGHVAFIGTPDDALEHFGVERLVDIYQQLAAGSKLLSVKDDNNTQPISPTRTIGRRQRRTSAGRQFRTLTSRNFDLLTRNRLTLAILAGSPAMVVGMMAVLFRPGSFSPAASSSMPAVQTLFWVAFASFFFGVTYGLLQIVGEFEIFRRERHGGLSIVAYVASKAAVLFPLLLGVNILMLFVLRSLDRLPSMSSRAWTEILIGAVLISIAAVSMGLCASALVRNPAQATLALPMLCFPQVLFAGAVVPVGDMTMIGKGMSMWQAGRWGFESLGRSFGLEQSVRLDPATAGYVNTFSGSPVIGWAVMVTISVLALAGTVLALDRRTRIAGCSAN